MSSEEKEYYDFDPNMKRIMMKVYNNYLKMVQRSLGDGVTYSDVLNQYGKYVFKDKFVGVFPSDKIPKLDEKKPYAIVNLDNSKLPGSHWIGLAYNRLNKKVMVYDSFGRYTKDILPSIKILYKKKTEDTEHDAEERLKEDNCGQRVLAWLLLFENYGPLSAKSI